MSDLPPILEPGCVSVRFPELGDLPRLLSGRRVRHTWPPPGVSVEYRDGSGLVVCGYPDVDGGTWYVASLADVAAGGDPGAAFYDQVADRGVPGWASWSRLLDTPLIYEVPRRGGPVMRWLRVNFAGSLGQVEQFTHKLDFGIPGADPTTSEADSLALAEQIAGIWSGIWGDFESFFPATTVYREVGVAELTLNTNGGKPEYSYGTQWYAYPEPAGRAGTAGASLPFEVATAVTLRTAHRGQSGRGRTYLPPASVAVMAPAGLFTPGYAQFSANAIAELINGVAAATPLVGVVVSQTHQLLNAITEVSCGVVPDSQRRRRRSQVEARVPGTAIAA